MVHYIALQAVHYKPLQEVHLSRYNHKRDKLVYMFYTEIQPIALAILTSIITGGFVLVFIEIGNRKNRNSDRRDQVMTTFMHKLSSFFRFISWCSSSIIFPKQLDEKEKHFKILLDKMDKYGAKLIISGGDYGVDEFSANELYGIANDINNIWYWHDKMNPCLLSWDNSCCSMNAELINKELKEISPAYLSNHLNVDLIAKVSGDFFVDIYQPIEYESFRYEEYQGHYNRFTRFVCVFFTFALLILCLMLFAKLPVLFLQISIVCVVFMLTLSLIMLSVDVKKQLKWRNRIRGFFRKGRRDR